MGRAGLGMKINRSRFYLLPQAHYRVQNTGDCTIEGKALGLGWLIFSKRARVRSSRSVHHLLNTRLSRLHFMVALNHQQTLYSHLRLILGGDPFKVIRL